MPRVSAKVICEESKRVPRRQVVRKASSPRVRKTTATGIPKDRVVEEINAPVRRAPTNVSDNKSRVRFSRKTIIFSGAFVAVLATSVWIGTADNGQINVASKIEERNNQIANGEFTADNSSGVNGGQMIPVQNSAPTVPNGGLKGRGVGTASVSQQAAVVAAEDANASSTEDISTSTEEINNNEASETNTESADGVNSDLGGEEGEAAVGSEI